MSAANLKLLLTTTLPKMLSNKLSIIIIALTLLWSLYDVSTRLMLTKANNSKSNDTLTIRPLILPKLSTNTHTALTNAYGQYTQDIEHIEQITGMSASEQNKQQGELDNVYINDNKLSLSAVIKNQSQGQQQTSALLLIVNVKSGEQTIEKFAHLSDVYGYRLTIEKNTQVVLTKQHDQGQQKIILTMYK